jgi:hypothetical protein
VAAARLVARQLDPPPGRDRDRPAFRVARHAIGRPLHGAGQQGLLHCVLAGLEASVPPDKDAEDLWCEFTDQALGLGRAGHISIIAPTSRTGRT